MVQYFDGQLVLEFIGTAAISYKINIDLIYCKASHPFILRIQCHFRLQRALFSSTLGHMLFVFCQIHLL